MSEKSRLITFYQRVIDNPGSWTAITPLVEKLEKQGVFNLFIQKEKIEELNNLLSAKLVEFKPVLTSEKNSFGSMFLDKAIHKMYDAGLDNLDETEIVFEVRKATTTKWVSIFENIMNHACRLANKYQAYIKQYGNLPYTTLEDINYLSKVFKDAFPLGIKYEMPSQDWLNANPDILKSVNLCIYFSDAYVCSVFANIQNKTEKKLDPNVVEAMAVSYVEKHLIAHFIAEYAKSKEQVNDMDLRLFVRNIKRDNQLSLMALYYMYALKSIN